MSEPRINVTVKFSPDGITAVDVTEVYEVASDATGGIYAARVLDQEAVDAQVSAAVTRVLESLASEGGR